MAGGGSFFAFLFGLALVGAAGCLYPGADVAYVQTPNEVVVEMLRLARVDQNDVVYDLGSGDGRLVIAAARDFGARGVGIEIDPRLVAQSGESARHAGVGERATFRGEELGCRGPASGVDALDPAADATDDLPGNRPDGVRHLAGIDPVAALAPDEHDLVAGRDVETGHVHHEHVHADRSHDRRAAAPDQDGAAARQPEVEPAV